MQSSRGLSFNFDMTVGDLGKGDGVEVFVAGLGFGSLDMMGSWVFIYLFHVSLHETFHRFAIVWIPYGGCAG
jgi:hypothetical protein